MPVTHAERLAAAEAAPVGPPVVDLRAECERLVAEWLERALECRVEAKREPHGSFIGVAAREESDALRGCADALACALIATDSRPPAAAANSAKDAREGDGDGE